MRDRLSGLTALLAVVERSSFTAAAADLGITPSAVSQIVRALEDRLGARLLQRTTRSVGLTEVGARFVARLKPALGAVEEAFASVGELRDRPAGRLRLTLPRVGYEQVLAPRQAAFLDAYPDIDLDISLDEGLEDIIDREFDAGIRLGEMVEKEMVGVRVSPDLRAAVVGSPSYFATRSKPEHPRELTLHSCINYRWRTKGSVYHWEFSERGKDLEIAVTGRLIVNDSHVMVQAALAGVGLAYVFESSVREHLASGRLVRVLEAFCPPFPGFFLYYPSRTHLAPKLRALVEFLKVRRGDTRRAGNEPVRPLP